MDPCELYENWDQMAETGDVRDALRDLLDEIADVWGLEGVKLAFDDLPDVPGRITYGEYDPNTNTITIDDGHLSEKDETLDTMFHESMHALHDQWGISEEDVADLHGSVEENAGKLKDELIEDCVSTDPPESGVGGKIPDIPGDIEITGVEEPE